MALQPKWHHYMIMDGFLHLQVCYSMSCANGICFTTIQAQTSQTHPPSKFILSNWCGLLVCPSLHWLGPLLMPQPSMASLRSLCASHGPFDLSRTLSGHHTLNTSTCPSLTRSKSPWTSVQSSIRTTLSKLTYKVPGCLGD